MALANRFEVDLGDTRERNFFEEDAKRNWKSSAKDSRL